MDNQEQVNWTVNSTKNDLKTGSKYKPNQWRGDIKVERGGKKGRGLSRGTRELERSWALETRQVWQENQTVEQHRREGKTQRHQKNPENIMKEKKWRDLDDGSKVHYSLFFIKCLIVSLLNVSLWFFSYMKYMKALLIHIWQIKCPNIRIQHHVYMVFFIILLWIHLFINLFATILIFYSCTVPAWWINPPLRQIGSTVALSHAVRTFSTVKETSC